MREGNGGIDYVKRLNKRNKEKIPIFVPIVTCVQVHTVYLTYTPSHTYLYTSTYTHTHIYMYTHAHIYIPYICICTYTQCLTFITRYPIKKQKSKQTKKLWYLKQFLQETPFT